MLYRETGQFKTSYTADQAIFPIRQDRYLAAAVLVLAYVAVPILGTEYWLLTIMIPFLVFALAAIGLNILTGYAGQVSLGTGGFMAVAKVVQAPSCSGVILSLTLNAAKRLATQACILAGSG